MSLPAEFETLSRLNDICLYAGKHKICRHQHHKSLTSKPGLDVLRHGPSRLTSLLYFFFEECSHACVGRLLEKVATLFDTL